MQPLLLSALALHADGAGPLVAVPVIAVLAWRRGAVDGAGALCGAAVGLAIAFGLGWAGVAMLGTLLVVGTLASRSSERRRGWLQTFCNGVVAAAAALAAAGGAPWGAAAASGALATALSDTAAGEWGRRLGTAPRALLVGRPLPPGTDGAMSWTGTLLGACAALPVPIVGRACGAPFDTAAVLAVAAGGLAGNVCDSVFGLLLQRRLGDRGNDWTNVLATACGAVAAATLALP